MGSAENRGSWVGSSGKAREQSAGTDDTRSMVRIAIDAMGGDHAPLEVVKGAVQAARELGVEVILTGPRLQIEEAMKGVVPNGLPVRVVDAPEIINDGEHPILAVMRKPKSSVNVAARLVKEGQADALVSAGSTGALMISSYQTLGPLPGVDRPIIGGPFLQLAPQTFVLDMGANVGCQAHHLLNFAITGSVFVREFLGIPEPTIALLNVGSEEGKGTEVMKEAYELLKGSGLNFIGNVEGMDIPLGKANVIVCDGFVGNVLLKFSEGMGRCISSWLNTELAGRVDGDTLNNLTVELARLLSPAEAAGGGPLWGIDGVAVVGHGSSKAEQVAAAIREAKLAVESNFIGVLRAEMERVHKAAYNNHHG